MKALKTKLIFLLAILVVIIVGPNEILAYTVNGHAKCARTGWVPYGAIVKIFEVDPLPGGLYDVEPIPLATVTVDESGNFTATFSWPSVGGGYEVGGPDLIFWFAQNIGGSVEIIYEENHSETQWNVADGDTLTFQITSEIAVCTNPNINTGSIPNDMLFLFTRIGSHETADIDCKGSDLNSEGYYRPRKSPYSFTGSKTDQPFGRTLDMFGWFGKLCQIAYYKVQYSPDGGTTWTDIETPLPNKWYDTSDPNPLNWHWISESMGPVSDGGQNNLYKIPFFVKPNTPWSYLDRVARFNTTLTSDGLCRLRITGYKWSGSTLVAATSTDILVDPNYGEIVLQVDNTPPTVKIVNLKLNNVSQEVCKILNFGTTSNDRIEVNFRAFDQKGHLLGYVLNATYGHNCTVQPLPKKPNSTDNASDDYENNSSGSPTWHGSLSYTVKYRGDLYGISKTTPPPCVPDIMPTCAYQFRLSVSKRTTNGYGLIYVGVEDTWHVTIMRE